LEHNIKGILNVFVIAEDFCFYMCG